MIEKFPGADTLEVSRDVEAALDDLRPGLAGITVDTNVFRPSGYIVNSVDNLTIVMIIGAVLGILVVLALLYSWRAALVSTIAIGLSMTAAALVVSLAGHTVNAMVMAGLVISLVVVIDEAIIGMENVVRQRREQRSRGDERPASQVIFDGTFEVHRVGLYAALIALLPLLPIVFMAGVSGALLEPLALAYAMAVVAAFIVALTVTPALAALLFSRSSAEAHESPIARRLQAAYSSALDRVTLRPIVAFAAAAALVVVGAVCLPFLGRSQLPEFEDRNLVVRWDAPPGTSAPEMARITERFTRELRATPGVENATGQVGRAILGDQVGDINAAEVFVKLTADAAYAPTRRAVENVAAGYPGLASAVETYERVSVRRAETGSDDPVTVTVFGPKLDVLRAKAEEIGAILGEIDGVKAVDIEGEIAQPHVQITVDLGRAQRYGLSPGDVRREAATLLAGLEVGSLFEEQKVFQVAVWTQPESRHSLTDIERLPLNAPTGGSVPLSAVADVALVASPAVIRHEAVSRRIRIGLALDGRGADAVIRDIRSRMGDVAFPVEHHVEVRGEPTVDADARTLMIGAGIAAGVGVLLLLQAAFASWRVASLVFVALITALAGGVIAATLMGDDITLASVVAFAAVLAIAGRNVILLFSRYRHLEDHEGMAFGREMVSRGARERFLPIVVTALATALALVPLLFTGARAGQEFAHPIAVVVLGGLIASTALSLFVMPNLYLRFGSRAGAPRRASGNPPTAITEGG